MPLQRFDRSTLPSMPWKNGGGVTREIACVPGGADLERFDWRISIAQVAADGPFSAFPGVDRTITLLEGAGMRLFTPEGAVDQRLDQALQPWSFAGEWPIHSTLLGGECHDFNVMTRRSRCRARVTCLTGSPSLPGSRAGVVLACGGALRLRSGDAPEILLRSGQGLWWHDEPHHWDVQNPSGATLLVVTIETDHESN